LNDRQELRGLKRRVEKLEVAHTAEVRYKEMERQRAKKAEQLRYNPRQGFSWTLHEREFVNDHLNKLCDDLSLKTGRTPLALQWELYHQLKRELFPPTT